MDKEERLRLMASGKMFPLILRMSIPTVFAQVINLLYHIVDKIYLGHIQDIGTDALAGVGITSSVITFISAFASFVSGGGSPLAAIALGKNDRDRAEKILGNGFFMLTVFSVVLVLLTFIFKKPLLYAIGASDVTYKYANEYLTVYLCGTFFVFIAIGLNTFITCQGRSGIAMFSVILGAVLNIALDPLFIFVFKLNVLGAALATAVSQAASAAFVLSFLLSNKAALKLKFSRMKPDLSIIGSILKLGIAPFVMSSTESFVGFVLNGSLKRYGADIYVSTLSVMQSGMQIAGTPLSGFGQGVTPILSYNYGRGDKDRLKQCFKYSLLVMFSYNFVTILFLMIFPATAAKIFTSDPALIALVKRIMPHFVIGMSIFGLQRPCQTTFVATKQAGKSLFIALLRKIILLIPLALILPRFIDPPVMGVFYAEPIADAISAITCITLFLISFKKILGTTTPTEG